MSTDTRFYFRREDLRAITLPWIAWAALTLASGLALAVVR